ncbi:MAG: serine--tRNA ligase, partial [Anaerolineae bacterium]
MLDIVFIREQPKVVKAALLNRNEDPARVDAILALDAQRRELLQDVETLRAERNRVSKEISRLRGKVEREKLITEMRQVGERIGELEAQLHQVESDRKTIMLEMPALPHESVPVGVDETDNVFVFQRGEPREFDFE